MATRYVYSGAAGAGTGADWANAHTTLSAAITASSAGDTFYVASDHAETQATALTLSFKGTAAAPDKVICVNRLGSVPPVSADLATGGSSSTTGASNLTIGSSSNVRLQGMTFSAGSGAASASVNFGAANGGRYFFKNCTLVKAAQNGISFAVALFGGTTAANFTVLDNTTISFGSTSDGIRISAGEFIWKNTPSAIQGATLPTTLFQFPAGTNTGLITLDGVDLSALGSGKTIFGACPQGTRAKIVNCKLGSSVTIAATPTWPGTRITVENSDSTSTGYRQEIYDYAGTLTSETTIVRSSGASDGVQALSWKVTTTANANSIAPFETFPVATWIATAGASTTLSLPIVNDGTTLTNADIWLEVEYLSSSSYPLAALASGGVADILASGTNLATDSTSTWTTTGLASPVKQTLSATFTPQMAGLVRAVVKVAKTSKTIYIDPKASLS